MRKYPILNIKHQGKRLVLFFFLTLILNTVYLILPPKVYAQSLSLSLWPPLLEVMMQPGKTITQVYKLTNNSDHELQITPQILPFEPVGEGGEIKINFSSPVPAVTLPHFSFASREKFNQAFLLPVGETREMVLKINLPPNNPEKDYYYTLLFATSEEPVSTPGGEASQSTTVAQIGSNILLTASQIGRPNLFGRITLFSAPFAIDSFSPTNFRVILENGGKTFWKPFGKIQIEGPFEQKSEIPLYEQNVLANSSRRLTVNSYRPSWPIGPFKAKLEFTLNENGQKLSSQITFWYFPYKLTIGIILLIFLFFLSRRLRRRFPR